MMNKQQFLAHYISTFLASYMASKYDSDCANGHREYQPIEDAMVLAECAWNQLEKYNELNGITS